MRRTAVTPRLLHRPRLLELLAARWSYRAVAVVAGPGFGKSVLIAQAAGEHRFAPRGAEIAIDCRDLTAERLLVQLADAVGCPPHWDHDPDVVLAAAGRRWPTGVCIVIDDVDELVSTADGAALLAGLVDRAPPPVHLVLAGRRPIGGLTRARAAGDVLVIEEPDLLFTPAELDELAELHGADASDLAATGGWPAVATLAAVYGVTGAARYVWENVLEALEPGERRVLAVAAAIGHGDGVLLSAAAGALGPDPAGVMSRVPMVADARGDGFAVHELWRRVVGDVLHRHELVEALERAVDALVARRRFDQAVRLCASHELWDRALDVVLACCDRGHPAAAPHEIQAWSTLLPSSCDLLPAGTLLRGLVARITAPFDDRTPERLRRAVERCRDAGETIGEIAALNELIFVLRNQGRCSDVPALVLRALELREAGFLQADGPVVLARSVVAEAAGDSATMLAELDAVDAGTLSPDWQAMVEFRRATALLTLGDEPRLRASSERCAELGAGSTLRHALPLARWFTGEPRTALAEDGAIVADIERSQVDAVALGAFATMLSAATGRLDEAAERLAACERAGTASTTLTATMRGYLVGIRALVAAAGGDEVAAGAELRESLAAEPLDEPLGWLVASRWLALAYVLVPESRHVIDRGALGTLHRRRVDVARLVVQARGGIPLDAAALERVRPGDIATTVPLPWSMTLAAQLAAVGDPRGRQLAEWLVDLVGEPARLAMREVAAHAQTRLAAGARRLLGAVTLAPSRGIRLELLGPPVLRLGDDVAAGAWGRERVRSLLAFLVLCGPCRREHVVEALWPELNAAAADRNLRVTLTYLQQVLEPDRRRGEAPFFVRQTGATIEVVGAPHLIVDVHELRSLVEHAGDAERRGLPSVALGHLERAVALWRGPCLTDVMYEEWAMPLRAALEDRVVSAAVRAAELHLAAGSRTGARRLARLALSVDRWSERAHRLVVAAALADGDHCRAARALAECDAALADVGACASAETEMLRRRLRDPASSVAAAATA